jgi:chorismate dehydratase
MQRIRISAVSYLNTKPFLYGIQESGFLDQYHIDLQTNLPAVCAEKLLKDEVDLGLVPVAIIPELSDSHIVGNYCIGSNGPVNTVMLYSDAPLDEIEEVMLDYQSRTSVMLAQVLAKEFWTISPKFTKAFEGYEKLIKGKKAAVVIGDRTFEMNGKFAHEFDLSEEWKKLTGLPFVFACWVSNKPLDTTFLTQFNKALEFGIKAIKIVAKNNQRQDTDINEYFQKHISYEFNLDKQKALNLFFEKFLALK